MKKIVAILWHSHTTLMRQASQKLKESLSIKIYSARFLEEEKEDLNQAINDMEEADLIYFYRSAGENIWDELDFQAKKIDKPFVCNAHDSAMWCLSNVKAEVMLRCNAYTVYGGLDNYVGMMSYLAAEVLEQDIAYPEPKPLPWEGIFHPDTSRVFNTTEEYFAWYGKKSSPTIGIITSKGSWANKNVLVEYELIKMLEQKGYNVISVFCYSFKDKELGTLGPGETVKKFFVDSDDNIRIDAMIKLVSFFLESGSDRNERQGKEVAEAGVSLLKKLDIPVLQPVVSYYKTDEEWREDPQGLSREIGWNLSLPEFEGVIEPIFIAGVRREGGLEFRQPIAERCQRLVDRLEKWVKLRNKPPAERKVAFILHNNPCASVEATVGGGANLDTLESVARILRSMKKAGYKVAVPADGKELIDNIMARKAISEFRWTTTDEIVKKGGVLKFFAKEEYEKWFNTLSAKVKERIIEAWGNPPGEEINGVPAAMVHEGKILVTGVEYENAIVCAQPKRGCAGARCDGRVCKILHDPDIPPTHQYLATYHYLEEFFKADVIVHVGTHGNVEFLPGKGVGLSGDCYTDIALGTIPHLYIYNADNPPEGTIAKRRSNAVLVNHMQTVLVQGGLYDDLAQLERYLEDYEKARISDPAQAHTLQHLIVEEIRKTNLDKQISEVEEENEAFAEVIKKAHGILSTIRNSQVQDGQHIFGDIHHGERRIDFINSIMRFESGDQVSLRFSLAQLMGLDLSYLLENQAEYILSLEKTCGAILEDINELSQKVIREFLKGNEITEELACELFANNMVNPTALKDLNTLLPRVLDLDSRIEASKEIDSLLSGFDGRYIPAGPSGLITRGRDDILPTGRNFYSLDPYRVPTRAAWEVGKRLADKVIETYIADEGQHPENFALYWMCNDIMWADGEGLAQMLYMLGVKPLWLPNGRVSGFEIISLEELGRPRIDLTVRVSGILRDNFSNCMELLDEAIQAVAALEELPEDNYIRKHTLEKLAENQSQEAWRNATLRIFGSKPGTYQSGVNLAVYASAWKDEQDLADIFVFWNGYAYGKETFGRESFKELQSSLKTVDITYNKLVSDEHDLFGCCGYFGTHGGLTAAAKTASGKEIKTYYGDTREPQHIEVRTLADELRRVVRAKLLNPLWIEGQKRHGYKGAGEVSKKIGRVYGWESTTQQVDDWIFDDITKTFIMDEENRKFFEEHNPWALEEISRRLLEAQQRGLWQADPEVLDSLKEYYLEIEGWIEEKMGDISGDFQGGAIDVSTTVEVADWRDKMQEIKKKLGES